jgi:hypothetical protein
MKMKVYTKIDDAGHGWLQVPLKEVHDSGADISSCSFRDKEYAYLEEDCDMYQFLISAGHLVDKELKVEIQTEHHEVCFVRNLQRF